MAHPRGFEPPTCRLGGGRSIQLSYGCVSCLAIVANKSSPVNEIQHFFRLPPHIIVQSLWKERGIMEREEEQPRDIDDLIFGDEEWYPSSR